MIYRREIDGLRALAVIPVILFHAGYTVFSGGYIGVDVFFVISGYLITSIIIGELEQGNFSIAKFYERRARRILPALFFVILCCLPFAWMWMLPSELEDFSQSIIAVVFFASNILFWREEGYFATAAELKPLLHTWSLAVEEQYYLMFPVFLLLVWRLGRNRVFWSICVIAAISLAASEWGWRNKPSANFYLAPTRAWELLIGSMCAFWLSGRQQMANNWLSLLGLMMIVFAIFYYDEATPFPSIYAVVPVLGTGLIILFGGAGTWVAGLLGAREFVGIGLISYSAYLWHQPLFAFARIRSTFDPSGYVMAALAILSLVLAYFSWRYIEQPFRQGRASILPTRGAVFAASGLVGSALLMLGLVGYIGKGFEQRFDKKIINLAKSSNDKANFTCILDYSPNHPIKKCLKLFKNSDRVALLGDSHANALFFTLRKALESEKISHYAISQDACVPLPGFRRFGYNPGEKCHTFNVDTLSFIRSANFKTVVLIARFPLFLHGNRFDNQEGGVEIGNCVYIDLLSINRSICNDLERRKRVLDAYEDGIRDLAKSFNIVLVYPIPEAGWDVPTYAFKRAYFEGLSTPISTSYDRYKDRSKEVTDLFDRLVDDLPNVYAARVDKVLCSETTGRCINANEKGIYYFDDDHLSNAGARLVVPTVVEAIKAANAAAR